jgi:hypothetical protein
MKHEDIPTPCNCEYRNEMFLDLQEVWKKYYENNQVLANDFAYTMIQLATYYLKKADATEDQVIEFAKKAIESLETIRFEDDNS